MNKLEPLEARERVVSSAGTVCKLFEGSPSVSRVGCDDTSGTDRMTPFPVPTQRRSVVSIKAVILTKEKPNLPVPEKARSIGLNNICFKVAKPC